jgi:hypothetical protein
MTYVLPYIDKYDPYYKIIIQDEGINVTHGDYPCDLNQRFKRLDGVIIQLKDWEWYPTQEKVISGVVMVELATGKKGIASILYFLESLKNGRLKFYSP